MRLMAIGLILVLFLALTVDGIVTMFDIKFLIFIIFVDAGDIFTMPR